jgi:hypothetical protein
MRLSWLKDDDKASHNLTDRRIQRASFENFHTKVQLTSGT